MHAYTQLMAVIIVIKNKSPTPPSPKCQGPLAKTKTVWTTKIFLNTNLKNFFCVCVCPEFEWWWRERRRKKEIILCVSCVHFSPQNNQADESKFKLRLKKDYSKMNMHANYQKKIKRSILTDKFLLETKLSSDLILSGFKKSSLLWTKFEDSVWLPSPTAGACQKQSDIIIITVIIIIIVDT